MKNSFEVIFSSVIGKDHKRSGKNNQEAYHYFANDDMITAVVCDGCTDGKNNEVGARIGSIYFKH